jgi:hypothetical protein
MFFGTSPLAADGLVDLSWLAGTVAETDVNTVPDAVGQCGGSDLSPTVGLEACEVELPNTLDVDGCTVADQVASLAADATMQGQFVSGIARLTQHLGQQGLISASERQASLRCAAQAGLP